jgi:PIN domain nuclease of toxin-antitoxin system
MTYVVDTHALIWYFTGSKRLSKDLREKIDEIRNEGERLIVPTIVLAEALYISERGRVKFDFPEMYRLLKDETEFEIVGFTREILEQAMSLRIPEIHDRIIAATASFYGAGIITKDKVLLRS